MFVEIGSIVAVFNEDQLEVLLKTDFYTTTPRTDVSSPFYMPGRGSKVSRVILLLREMEVAAVSALSSRSVALHQAACGKTGRPLSPSHSGLWCPQAAFGQNKLSSGPIMAARRDQSLPHLHWKRREEEEEGGRKGSGRHIFNCRSPPLVHSIA